MSIPKAVGIETEYGIVTQSISPAAAKARIRHNPIAASRAVVGEVKRCGLIAAPQRSAFGWQATEQHSPAQMVVATGPAERFESEENGWMLANGARVYVDHAHPEYCTPECLSAREVVAADKAGEIILERCRQAATADQLSQGRQLVLYKNNSDHKGNSYGCHENYLLATGLYQNLLAPHSHWVTNLVLPFFISRTLLCGSGKVGSENGTAPAGFQLAQRADFFETLVGVQTTHHRPLFNTRDEAHAELTKYRRLHVIIGDANLSEFSTFLKVGTAQLLLRMLEDSFLTADLSLADPLAAMRAVSRDLTFSLPLKLANGGQMTALEIQRVFLESARRYHEQVGNGAEEAEVITQWDDALNCLATDWRRLAVRLDWAIKRNLFERYLTAQQRDWGSVTEWQPVIEEILGAEQTAARAAGRGESQRQGESAAARILQMYDLPQDEYQLQRKIYFGLRRLDLEYHDIRRGPAESEMGLFYRLQHKGAVERLLSDEEIERMIEEPPDGTRARVRGDNLRHFKDSVVWADWSGIRIAGRAYGHPYGVFLNLADPLGDSPDEGDPGAEKAR